MCKILSHQSKENIYIHFIIRNYHSLRRMHVRGDQDPYQITRRSLTEAQESKISNDNEFNIFFFSW